jgi:cell wall-associated NlpC family hydrolase
VTPSRLTTALCGFLLVPVLGVVVLAGGGESEGPLAACVTAGPVTGLNAVQAANARTIVTVTQSTLSTSGHTAVAEAQLIGLMTAYQESKLRNLANPNVAGSLSLPNQGTGSDHDSVGLFQQRANWGTGAQRMDPVYATTKFVSALAGVPDWQLMPPGAVAQLVQVSAAPDAYAQWETAARAWLAQITGSAASTRTPAVATGTDMCGGSGLASSGSLTVPGGYALPPGTSPAAARAVTFALAQLGKPYVIDAAGPYAYDCSGLTMAAWAAGGVWLPHWTVAQAQAGTAVAEEALLAPGDLVLIPGSDGTLAEPGHVGMFIAAGLVIEAPQSGDVVKLVGLADFAPVAALRHIA